MLGAVHHPATDTLFVGGPGLPSTRDGVPLPPLADRPLAAVCATTYLHYPRATRGHLAAFGRVAGRGRDRADARLRHHGRDGDRGRASSASASSTASPTGTGSRAPPIIRGAGGVARQVEAAGVTWSVAGAPTAVDDVCGALGEGLSRAAG